MAELFRDVAQYYPVAAAYTAQGVDVTNNPEYQTRLEHVLDARVVHTIDPADLEYTGRLDGAPWIAALLNITGYGTTAGCSVSVYWNACVDGAYKKVSKTFAVASFVGRDAPAVGRQATQSYVVLSADVHAEDYSGLVFLLHPDCLFVEKRAPRINWYLRGPVTSKDVATSEPTALGEGFDKAIKIKDGNNTTVVYADGTLTLTAGEGLGTGVYTKPPYVDTEDEEYRDARCIALRSINGLHGDVSITGTGSVSVNTTGDADNLGIDIFPAPSVEDETA